jgi:radical SAM superfamily enzyme YgiQ (UPF0313 family)
MKKILLINPPYAHYDGVEGQGGKNAPLNLAYLAAFVRERIQHTEVKIIDAEALELKFHVIYEKANKFSPDLIGITFPTPVYNNVKKICQDIKKNDKAIRIVLGGPHPSALPIETLNEFACDFVVIGEGEQTFFDLITALKKSQPLDLIPGIAYKDNGKISINQPRELIRDLDQLPFPAKDLLPLEKYYLPPTKRIRKDNATNMITSRGCPYNCNFCMAKKVWGNKTRLRSVSNVINEIRLNIETFKMTEFSFHDEFFTLKRDRVFELCKTIVTEGMDISWVCMARAGSVDLKMLKMMKEAGCGKIGFGFESGSERMLKLMNKKINLTEAIESVRLCKKAGIKVFGAFILGYPGEDIQSIQETVDFASKLDCDTVAFFIAIPYPGTALYDDALEKGYLKKPVNWNEFAPVSNLESPLNIPNFTPDELIEWKKNAYKKFYFRPRYILKRLCDIKTFSDIKDLWRGVKIFKKVT